MIVELEPGEEVHVTFKDADGDILVSFGHLKLVVASDLPDDTGRRGIIYQETWNTPGTPTTREKTNHDW